MTATSEAGSTTVLYRVKTNGRIEGGCLFVCEYINNILRSNNNLVILKLHTG